MHLTTTIINNKDFLSSESPLTPLLWSVLAPLLALLFSHSVASNSLRPHGLQHARLPCPPVSQSVRQSMSVESAIPSNHHFLCCPFSSRLQSFPATRSFPTCQLLTSGGQRIGNFSFSISPSDEYSVLISFRIGWFDLLAVQGTLKSLLHDHNSKA